MSRSAYQSLVKRLGFHYFPDYEHYRQKDAELWIPLMSDLGSAWMVLQAPIQRAIPEDFITRVQEEGMEPIIHFDLKSDAWVDHDDLRVLLNAYSRWGVNYIMIFDRPNSRRSWSPAAWVQMDLVERFLDGYLPLVEIILEEKLIPVFPPLEPGGDFWDLSFLRLALQSILRRGFVHILDSLVIGAYGDIITRPLDWGSGGSTQWSTARPYPYKPDSQDHRGFRIFDWYFEVCRQELGELLPVILFGLGGYRVDGTQQLERVTENDKVYQERLNDLFDSLTSNGNAPSVGTPFPSELLGCIFEVMIPKRPGSGEIPVQGIKEEDRFSNLDIFRQRQLIQHRPVENIPTVFSSEIDVPTQDHTSPESGIGMANSQGGRFSHYVLLPLYAWGAADWDLEMIRPLIQQSHPTVGYSLEEALQAEQVTVVGGPGAISDEALELLRQAGCLVKRMMPDGTVVAT